MLAVFRECSRTDHLDLSPGKSRFQDIRSVHAALGITGADDGVDLVDHKDDVPLLADLFNKPLHTAFKLTAKLCPGDQRCQIQQKNLLLLKLIRHIPSSDALGKSFRDRRLADTRFPNQARIVLLSAVENLDDTLELFLPADHGIQFTGLSTGSQVNAVAVQKFPFSIPSRSVLRAARHLLSRSGILRTLSLAGILLPRGTAVGTERVQEFSEKRKRRGLPVLIGL